MKTNMLRVASLFMLAVATVGCAESGVSVDDTKSYEIKLNKEDITSDDASIEITTNGAWNIASNRSWCQPEVTKGSGSTTVKFNLEENTLDHERKAKITIFNDLDTYRLEFTQLGGVFSEDMHYKLPVVFHTLYTRESNPQFYVSEERIHEIFKTVQDTYANCGVDLGFEFVLAEEGPDGKLLETPGINRIKVDVATIKYKDFMYLSNSDENYAQMMWDPSKYINIAIYQTVEDLLGITSFAYLMSSEYDPSNSLTAGAIEVKEYIPYEDMNIPICVTLNNKYIFNNGSIGEYFNDMKSTAAHEIGHLLGLKHVFYEDEFGDDHGSGDTDHCVDTPTYNRALYRYPLADLVSAYMADPSKAPTEDEVENKWKKRTASAIKDPYEFVSNNIMDYYVGNFTEITEEQKARMRFIIQHSPYVPGCKAVKFESKTKASSAAIEDFAKNAKVYTCGHAHNHNH